MKNKIVMKNKKVRLVFKNVDDEKFKKVYKYLSDLKKKKKVKKVKKEEYNEEEEEEEEED